MAPQYARIRLLARCTRWLVSLALVTGTLCWAVLTWLALKAQFGGLPQGYVFAGAGLIKGTDGELIATHPMLLWAYVSLALGITAYGLLCLWRLMRLFEAGIVFNRQAPNYLSAFAICILLRELLDIVALPLISMTMTGGKHSASFNVDSGTMHVLFITLLFFLMSRIMAAAFVVADDNKRII